MKGMMVTLLLLVLTGTVDAQQFGQNNTSFGSSNSTRPAPDPNDFSTTSQEAQERQRSDFLQLTLPLDQNVVKELREIGEIKAPIGRPAETSEVIFGFAQPLKEAKVSTNFKLVRPIDVRNGALIFEFTESDLRAAETGTLRYRLDQQEIGRYETIVVRMAGNQRQNPPFQATDSTDQFAGRSDQRGLNPLERDINPPDRNPAFDNRPDVSAIDPFDRDKQLRETVGNGGAERLANPAAPNRFASNDPSPPTRGLGLPFGGREPEMESWKRDSQSQPGEVDRLFDVNQRRAENLARQQDARDSELRMREQLLVQKEQELLDRQRRERLRSEASGSPWDSNPTSPFAQRNLVDQAATGLDTRGAMAPYFSSPATNSGVGDRYANLGTRPMDGYQPTNGVNGARDTSLQNLAEVVLDGFNSLKQSNLDLNHRIQLIESQQRPGDPAAYRGASLASTDGTSLPVRSNRNFSPTISGYQAQIPGAGEQNLAPNQNMTGPIYFMLICSLGLNIYLGLISRNFYVRYNELADELRETFSASITN